MILERFLQKMENFLNNKKIKNQENFRKIRFYDNDFFKYQSYSKLNADYNAENRLRPNLLWTESSSQIIDQNKKNN